MKIFSRATRKSLETEIEALKAKIENCEKDNANSRAENEELKEKITNLKSEIVNLQEKNHFLAKINERHKLKIDKYRNQRIESLMGKYKNTIYFWLEKGVLEKELCEFILTATSEMSLHYIPKQEKTLEIGDIVDCNYGIHLKGEPNGGHIFAIVLDVKQTGQIRLARIIKGNKNITEKSVLSFDQNDMKFYQGLIPRGVVSIESVRYVHCNRINKVVGRCNTKFLNKVVDELVKYEVDLSRKVKCYYVNY